MQLVYAFVYYFLLVFVSLNFSLIIFALKPLRKLLQKIQTRFQTIFNNQYISYLINFSFAIIFLIMADSVRTFYLVNNQINTRNICHYLRWSYSGQIWYWKIRHHKNSWELVLPGSIERTSWVVHGWKEYYVDMFCSFCLLCFHQDFIQYQKIGQLIKYAGKPWSWKCHLRNCLYRHWRNPW